MDSAFLIWLFYQYPEVLMLTITGPRLLGLQTDIKRIVVASCLFSLLVPVSRAVFPGGMHTIIIFGFFVPLIRWLYQTSWRVALPPAMLSFSLLLFGDIIFVPSLCALFDLSGRVILTSVSTHLIAGYLSSSLLLLFFIAALAGFSFVPLAQIKEDNH